ncbi:MAG TPA: histidine phosphatase family protein [Candidatus Binataceae bacterium]|nr:histidine phosphatase family protein [Candidatus Binataceae bacterium]
MPPDAALTLVLVRHGETEDESSIRYHGRNDVALSDLGRAQMRSVRRAIEGRFGFRRFSHIFSSPLIRALESARIITGESAISTLDEFAEVDFGLFEGLTAEEIRERHPEEFARWNLNRPASDYQYPSGEHRGDFARRIERGLTRMLDLIDREPLSHDARAIVVAHRGVIRTIVSILIATEPHVDLGSIQILVRDRAWRPELLDDIAHLEE